MFTVLLKEYNDNDVLLLSRSIQVENYKMRYEINCDDYEFYILQLHVDGKICEYIIDANTDDLHLVFIKAVQNSINTNTCMILTGETIVDPEDSRRKCFKILSIGGTLIK